MAAPRGTPALRPASDSCTGRIGELTDVFVASGKYQALVSQEPGAWFALGWLAARAKQLRAQAGPELRRAFKMDPPAARR